MGFNPFAWFTKDRLTVLEGIGKTIAKLFLGRLADNAWTQAKTSVWKAEQTGLPGDEKFEYALKDMLEVIKSPATAKWVWSVLLEIAVGVLRVQKGQI